MTTPASESQAALRAGRDAARDGKPVTDNPHRGDADTARERVLARMWTLGYQGGNPVENVDYTS